MEQAAQTQQPPPLAGRRGFARREQQFENRQCAEGSVEWNRDIRHLFADSIFSSFGARAASGRADQRAVLLSLF